MNHKPTDPRRTRLLPSLSRLARKMQAHDDARNLSLLKKTAALLYLAILLVNGFHIGTSPDSEGYFTAGAHLFGGDLDFFQRPTARGILSMGALMFLLVMLRPFFICLTPILLLAYLYFFATSRAKIKAAVILSAAFVTVALLSYCLAIQEQHGMFTLSKVSAINRCIMASPQDHKEIQKFWTTSEGFPEYVESIDRKISQDKLAYAKGRIRDFLLSCPMYYPNAGFGTVGKVMNKVVGFPLWFTYVFVFLFMSWQWTKRREKDTFLYAALLSLCCIATIFTAVWGAYAEFPRLMMPMYPCLCLMAGMALDKAAPLFRTAASGKKS